MAPRTALALVEAPSPLPGAHRPPRTIGGSRGVPTRILLDVNDALAPCLEGMALADEAVAAANRICAAASAGSRAAAINEAGRLAHRAARYRAEFTRMAEFIEGPDDEGEAA